MFVRRASVLFLLALLCAIVAYWTMQLAAPRPAIVPVPPPQPSGPEFDAAVHARLFGGAVDGGPSNVRVVGVIAHEGDRSPGVAILAIDNKPGRAYAAGQSIGTGLVLASVHADRVVIDQGGALTDVPVPRTQPGVSSSSAEGRAAASASAPGGGARLLNGGANAASQGRFLPGVTPTRQPAVPLPPQPQPQPAPQPPNAPPEAPMAPNTLNRSPGVIPGSEGPPGARYQNR